MALIECPKCGKQISDLAKTCTYCGYSLKEPESHTPAESPAPDAAGTEKTAPEKTARSLFEGDRKIWWILGGVFAFMALIALILTLALGGKNNATSGTDQSSAPTEAAVTKAPEKANPFANLLSGTPAPQDPTPQAPENGGSGGFDLGNLFNNLINSTNP